VGDHLPDRGGRAHAHHGLRHPAHPGAPPAGDSAQAR
jgi:hypothetical protein